jgi:exodeoxyribonuclease VII large subunit
MLRRPEIGVNYQSRIQEPVSTHLPMPATPETEIYSVARLNREARRLLEEEFFGIWVSGEISNLARPASGHIYFSLKDQEAQVQCAMFRRENRRVSFSIEDGLQVLVQARVSIYEPQGRYQLIVEQMEEAGEGLLRRRFEELKNKLAAEGLFSEEHKQPLPAVPQRIGVVTSPTGAAIRDILNILKRRYPLAAVTIYPTRVQGKQAEHEIVAALATAVERNECDVVILARGGGSLEDLWCFNEEVLARAIYNCPLPVVAGIGHEVDVTIADLVADQRAPTPSGAAELIVPDTEDLLRQIRGLERRAILILQREWSEIKNQASRLDARLLRVTPAALLRQLQQRGDELTRQLVRNMAQRVAATRNELKIAGQRLRQASPARTIETQKNQLATARQFLTVRMQRQLERRQQEFRLLATNLNTVSPLATLDRGYAIASTKAGHKIITDATQVQPDDDIRVRLARGQLDARVTRTEPAD